MRITSALNKRSFTESVSRIKRVTTIGLNAGPSDHNGIAACKRGFTVTELLMGLVILLIVMTPLLFMMTTSRRGLMSEERYFQALFLAQKVAETFHAQLARDPKHPLEAPEFEHPFEAFKCHVKTEPVDGDELFQQVTVAIHWEEMGQENSIQLPFRHTKRFSLEIGYKLEYPWEDDD